jgi:hypothetical protein
MASLIARGKGKHVLRAKTKFAAWKGIERFHYTPTLLRRLTAGHCASLGATVCWNGAGN